MSSSLISLECVAFLYPERTVHRADILGPYGSIASNRERPSWTWWYHLKQYVLKPMLGRRPMPMQYLAVQAFILLRTDHG